MTTIEKIVVLAKAIPARHLIHGEITCVAGISLGDNKWRRLHPVPTSLLSKSYFMKFSIIEVKVDNWIGQHQRLEDRHLVNYVGCSGRMNDWENQRAFLEGHVDQSVDSIISSGRSLGIIKPTIEDFYRDANGRLRYRFRDAANNPYNLVCREWEALALANKYPDPRDFNKVKSKFCEWMIEKRDPYFVIGTTADNVTKMVVAVHYPPKTKS